MNFDVVTEQMEYDLLAPERETIRALIVDDDTEDAFLFTKLLTKSKQMDFLVTSCRSVEEAARLITSEKFDIIYVDYWLGLETSIGFIVDAGLKQLPPLILITGLDTPDIRRCAYRAGAAAFLSKDNLSIQAIEGVTLAVLERQMARA